jgi:hypothetical protein
MQKAEAIAAEPSWTTPFLDSLARDEAVPTFPAGLGAPQQTDAGGHDLGDIAKAALRDDIVCEALQVRRLGHGVHRAQYSGEEALRPRKWRC